MEADPGLLVTGPANYSPDANAAVHTLLGSWTHIYSSSPVYTCPQLASWIRGLGAQEFDEETIENAEAWAAVMFNDMKLKGGQSWARVKDVSLFRDKLKISDVYAQMFWDAFVRDDVPVVSHTPVVNCSPGVRAPLDDASSSSLSSHALNDILQHNAHIVTICSSSCRIPCSNKCSRICRS